MIWSGGVKRVLVGRPFATAEAEDHLLPKRLALPLFASDPLSSVAYATEEIMLVLVTAGVLALSRMVPISLAIATLVAVVVTSYRQTVHAYPQGGGAYLVTRDNLGLLPAMVAAASLLVDYVLTVAVSVTAGVAAVTSAFPSVLPWRVSLAVTLIILLTLANLRGVRETGRLFAAPTYLFFASVMIMLVVGFARCLDGVCPQAETASMAIEAEVGAVGVFLVLRAFASGSTALTGIEAIADGVQAFERPKAKNAAATLSIMAAMSISMFLGITALASLFDIRVSEATLDQAGSVISQVGRTAFAGGPMFYVLQFATVGILVLAANTAYQDFPRLSAILAGDRLMPRQMRHRGDRLVFSNGILVLAALAIALVIGFNASLSRLIQLYVVGVFTSFTLSQTSMVRRWLKLRSPGWWRSMVVNAVGAVTTGVVLVIVVGVKFAYGAWIVIVAIPVAVLMMWRIRAHYQWVAAQLSLLRAQPAVAPRIKAVVLVGRATAATLRAVRFAETLGAEDIQCVHVAEGPRDDLALRWPGLYGHIPLRVLTPRSRRVVRPLRRYIRELRRKDPDGYLTVIVSDTARGRARWRVLTSPRALLIKATLLFERGVNVTSLMHLPAMMRTPEEPAAAELEQRVVVIPIGGVTQPALQGVAYARASGAHPHIVHVEIDEEYAARVRSEWQEAHPELSLDVLQSPYRSTTDRIVQYVREIRSASGPGSIVEVIIPEFIVPTRFGRLLHNQTGIALKAALGFEPDVAVTSAPWHLLPESEGYSVHEVWWPGDQNRRSRGIDVERRPRPARAEPRGEKERSHRMSPRTQPGWRGGMVAAVIVGAIILGVSLASCQDSRPGLDAWEEEWRATVNAIPAPEDMSGPDVESLCGGAVGTLRRAEADLVPSPNDDIDAAVLEWVEFSESVFFECPRRTGEHAGFPAGYEEINRLATEVDALIEFERSLGDG